LPTTGLPSLKINELDADNIDGHFPIRKSRSLPPLGKRLRRDVSDDDIRKSSNFVHNLTVQHRNTSKYVENSGIIRSRYLLWVPAKTTGKQKIGVTQPVPVPSKCSSSRSSPRHHLHVAFLPSGTLGSNILEYEEPSKTNRLPKVPCKTNYKYSVTRSYAKNGRESSQFVSGKHPSTLGDILAVGTV
jgi:hypothetical protein